MKIKDTFVVAAVDGLFPFNQIWKLDCTVDHYKVFLQEANF